MMIKTTHVGSLPRTPIVADLLFGQEKGLPFDVPAFDKVMMDATRDILAKQREAGVDIPSDGETSKISYATYIKDRLTGFDGDSPREAPQDLQDFPVFLQKLAKAGGTPQYRRPRCVGPIAVKTLEPLHKDIAAMKAGMAASGSRGYPAMPPALLIAASILRTCWASSRAISARRSAVRRDEMAAMLKAPTGLPAGNAMPTAAVPGVNALSRKE